MAVKTKVTTHNNEADDFTKELLSKLHYMAQSANNIFIKKFDYLSDKLSFDRFQSLDKNSPRTMEILVFENKEMITLFFESTIYDDTNNSRHNKDASYFCQLKYGKLYIPSQIYFLKLKENYLFVEDIKLFFKKEYKSKCIQDVQIVNNDNFFFENTNIQPYRRKLYSVHLNIETLSGNEQKEVLNDKEMPLLSKDQEANKIYNQIYEMQMTDLIHMENYDRLLIPKYIELIYYEAYGFIEKAVTVLALKDGDIKFLTSPDFKFQEVGSMLESNIFVSKTELYNALEEMAISQINKLENRFFPSKQIENKEKFLQLMSELYDRRAEVKKEIFNLFNAEFNETLQQLSVIVDKNKTDNIV
jgi:hypothetical protein